MPMSSGLTSTLSEFTKKSEFAKNPLAGESSNKPPRRRTRLNLITRVREWLGKLVRFTFTRYLLASTFARYLLVFFVGVAATLAWQSFSGGARKTIAGWSPRLAWLAPAAVPHGISPDRIKATSLALAAVHQSVDKLGVEIGRMETQAGTDKTAASPPSRRGSRRP
jgi:hypothetical protein